MGAVTSYEKLEESIREIYKSELDPKLFTVKLINFIPVKGWGHKEYNVRIQQSIPNGRLSSQLFSWNFNIISMLTGCGAMTLYGWSYWKKSILNPILYKDPQGRPNLLTTEEADKWNSTYQSKFLETWNLILDDMRVVDQDGPGVIITTAGQSFYDEKESYNTSLDAYGILTDWLGFKVVDEYKNHQHGPDYKQRLLSLHI